MISLYIHIPFCEKKCNYCNFISFVGKGDLQRQYVEALIKEMGQYKGQTIKTIFIGGGTPSVLYDGAVEQIFDAIKQNFTLVKNCEISIEVNPNSLTQEKIDEYKRAGINRVSLGIQNLNNDTLKYLGRVHNSQQALEAIKLLQSNNLSNINADIIYGVDSNLNHTVETLAKTEIPHISAYSIIYEKGTPLAKAKPMPDDEILKQRKFIEKTLKQYHIHRYEVSAYARKGFECMHNQNYWRCGEYIGLGCAAHSYFNGKRYNNTNNLEKYIACPTKKYNVTMADLHTEKIMLGLRTAEGVAIAGKDSEITQLVKHGLVKIINGKVVCTTKGFDILNQIILKLV